MKRKTEQILPDCVRRLLLAWLLAVTVAYLRLPDVEKGLEGLEGLQHTSFSDVLLMTAVFYSLLVLLTHVVKMDTGKMERYGLLAVFVLLSASALSVSFTVPFSGFIILIGIILMVYASRGYNVSASKTVVNSFRKKSWNGRLIVSILTVCFFVFVSLWTVCRVLTYAAPSFDFGIFSQMFYHMRTTGLPNTTIERDGLLSHFQVHVSPIYYLMLPFYCIYPEPVTLQILQAAVLASAVVPLWKLARLHGHSPAAAVLFCQLLMLYPAYSGGAGYDLHENAFLTPLLLWLFYGIDRRNGRVAAVFALLTLMVKEDAAVYVAVIGLWLMLRSWLDGEADARWKMRAGGLLLIGAILWFILATGYLAACGDGVMTNRYSNLMYDGSGSLLTVVKAAILSPLKVLYECADSEKMGFVALTMLPLVGLPLFTRKYERYLLLIPYVLVNLVSDYTYQHDIFFQYTYGSSACLFYLAIVNAADGMAKIKNVFLRYIPLLLAVACSAVSFCVTVVPVAVSYPVRYMEHQEHYGNVGAMLDRIPENASVTATTFYTVPLSDREILYDVRYASKVHLLSTEYVVLGMNQDRSYRNYATADDDGYGNLTALLEANGYRCIVSMEDTLVIYQKSQMP